MSETRSVDVKIRPGAALERAITLRKGKILGAGTYKLYSSEEIGFGFTLPGWQYPLILKENGTLAYDDYHGNWGNGLDVEAIGHEYTLTAAEEKADSIGLYHERVSNTVKVHFDEGRAIYVFSDGRIEAEGFNGIGCSEACAQFAEALGQTLTVEHKAEYFQEHAKVNQM